GSGNKSTTRNQFPSSLSAYALQSEIEKSRDAGCTAYLTKPIRRKTLLETIEKYSEARRSRPGQEQLPEKIQASVDERLRSIIPAYLQGRRKDISIVLAALDSRDYEAVRTVGHKMGGSGSGYGFPDITAI